MFSAFLHLVYRWTFDIACVIGVVTVILLGVLLCMEKGSFKERWRNTGGGT